MLNAKYLIGDIQERARERKLSTLKQNKPFSSAEPNGETKDDIRFDSAKSKRKQEPIQNIDKTPKTNQFDTPVHENKESAELAGVITTPALGYLLIIKFFAASYSFLFDIHIIKLTVI
ncbi:hypothetical protein [Staphylococcus agnetis]|uniref:hypothetical protein n=1 Tax=Staphylococcus agnetis TaxID=985762 RepID=UPI0011A9E34D|nr:hypothetical protein [Staphylococcus agnetis]